MEEIMRLQRLADANLASLARNPYPGRGIVVGLDETGENLVQVYWIMGRSENSRNRVFKTDEARLFTEAADPSKVQDPSLIIYNAMLKGMTPSSLGVVSNGNQTDDVAKLAHKLDLYKVMQDWMYEPDKPNFTPRITAISMWLSGKAYAEMSIVRKSLWSNACDRHLYEINHLGRGFGHCITTYSGDGTPLPAFQGEPHLLPFVGDAGEIAARYWLALNESNRVSLAVKFISKNGTSHITVMNKYQKVKSAA